MVHAVIDVVVLVGECVLMTVSEVTGIVVMQRVTVEGQASYVPVDRCGQAQQKRQQNRSGEQRRGSG